MKMLHETILTLKTGRFVKVTACEKITGTNTDPEVELNVLIKDPNEAQFRPSIGYSHPKYWKLKTLDPSQSKLLELEYAGISKKEINRVAKEFRSILRRTAINLSTARA